MVGLYRNSSRDEKGSPDHIARRRRRQVRPARAGCGEWAERHSSGEPTGRVAWSGPKNRIHRLRIPFGRADTRRFAAGRAPGGSVRKQAGGLMNTIGVLLLVAASAAGQETSGGTPH